MLMCTELTSHSTQFEDKSPMQSIGLLLATELIETPSRKYIESRKLNLIKNINTTQLAMR